MFSILLATFFAELDENNIVKRVIVADQAFVDTMPGRWVEADRDRKIKTKNGAARGWKYEETKRAFIPPQPFASWVLDETEFRWKAPKAMPAGKDERDVEWDEATKDWKARKK